MMEILINELDSDLRNCEYFANTGDFTSARTFYNHAFGKMQMFVLLNLKLEDEAIYLWDTNYRPEFEKIIYGV